jgi:thymidylate synthase (FAD)
MSTARLIAITQPVAPELDGLDLQGVIAYCARVSNPSNQENKESSALVDYMIKHKHWSPFEMVSATIEITTTRDIARQILRHRSCAFQEFSARYSDPTQLGFKTREARMQDKQNRQNSLETDDEWMKAEWENIQQYVINESHYAYDWAISAGIAKEVARSVLPEGLTASRLYMAATLRSWLHYCELRTGPETQKEHRQVATDCAAVLAPHCALFGRFANCG